MISRFVKISVLLLAAISCLGTGQAQVSPYPEFAAPVDIPMILSGNFGEFRRNHFHTGIDIKTQGVQGKNILSVADGYVSRINISPRGYGNALYIDHPNGYTSVYAHLKVFNDEIERYITARQYEQETWAIEYYPEPGEIEVVRSQLIALSGNSGSSAGPHLHFEIRETISEHPINAMKLGYVFKDEVKPTIQGLRVYPLDEYARVENGTEDKSFTVKGSGGTMTTTQDTIHVNGTIGLALHTFDKMDNANNKYGIYSLRMDIDGNEYYSHAMDKLDFETFRYVNTHKDYDLFREKKWRYHKCFLSDNNALEIYDAMVDRGRIHVSEGEVTQVFFSSIDANGNESTLSAVLKGHAAPESIDIPADQGLIFFADTDNAYRAEDVVLLAPQGCLYDQTELFIKEVPSNSIALSRAYSVQNVSTPLQDYITIKIQPNEAFTDSSKLLMLDTRGGLHSIGGEYKNGWVEARTRAFGTYQVGQDLRAPVISKVEGLKPKSGRPNKVTVRLSDDLSGIDSIRAEVDGQWIMMRHNNAKSWATGTLDVMNLSAGEHVFTFLAVDAVGNEVKKVIEFVTR